MDNRKLVVETFVVKGIVFIEAIRNWYFGLLVFETKAYFVDDFLGNKVFLVGFLNERCMTGIVCVGACVNE